MELWRATELKLAAWEQNRPQQPPLSLPTPTTEALPAPSPKQSNQAPPSITMIEASTVTDSILTVEASTLTDSIQMIDAFTTTESVTPMEKTETPPPRPTKQVATQTGPPLRDYRAELKAEIARSDRREQWHKEAMARLQEQASSRVAELNTHAEHMLRKHNEEMSQLREQAASKDAEFKQQMKEYSAALAEKEQEVLDLHAALDYAKDWNRREDERNRRREEELVAANAELQSQRMTFKEMVDEFMLKWKIVNEQKAELTDSYNALQEEKIILREKL